MAKAIKNRVTKNMIYKNEYKIEQIRLLGKVYGWQEIGYNEVSNVIIFRRKKVLMNIFWTTMTVSTALKHPKLGKTQLFRKNVSFELLEKLLDNPRQHTKLGYTEKLVNNSHRWRT